MFCPGRGYQRYHVQLTLCVNSMVCGWWACLPHQNVPAHRHIFWPFFFGRGAIIQPVQQQGQPSLHLPPWTAAPGTVRQVRAAGRIHWWIEIVGRLYSNTRGSHNLLCSTKIREEFFCSYNEVKRKERNYYLSKTTHNMS